MADISVRRARPTDLQDVARLLSQLHPTDPPLVPGEQEVATAWSAILKEPTRHLLVAEAAGALVGTTDCIVVANLTHQGSPYIVVENAVVDRSWRDRRVATQLIEAVLELARDHGC